MKARRPRPGKLRTQVLAGVLLITLGALAVFDVAAVTALRTYLIDRTNVTLKSALSWTRPQLHELLPQYRKLRERVDLPVFGEYYIGFVPARGQVAAHDGTVTAAANWPRGLRVTLAVPAWRPDGSLAARDDQLEAAEAAGPADAWD